MAVRVECSCTWQGVYATPAVAEYALRRHSCTKQRRRLASARRGYKRRAAIDRTPKPCEHKQADHEHGTYACYVLDACRCHRCARANRDYEADRVRQQAYGRWGNLVDAEPAREHVRRLQAAGMGLKTIVKRSGISSGTITKLMYGVRRADGSWRPPATRITPTTHDRVLSVPLPTVAQLAPGARTEATGTRRRLQALATLGWSINRLAADHDLGRQALDHAIDDETTYITVATAHAVHAIYDRLWATPAPGTDQRSRISVSRTRSRAARLGWAPPLAWDDESIDDPAAVPLHDSRADTAGVDHAVVARALSGPCEVPLTRAQRWLVVPELARRGWSDSQIADHLRASAKTVLRDRQALGIPTTYEHAAARRPEGAVA